MTHEEIAKAIGSAREAVSRTLKQMVKKGDISLFLRRYEHSHGSGVQEWKGCGKICGSCSKRAAFESSEIKTEMDG